MLVRFKKVQSRGFPQDEYIETRRILSLSQGSFNNGNPTTCIQLDNDQVIEVIGDMDSIAKQINIAKQVDKLEART